MGHVTTAIGYHMIRKLLITSMHWELSDPCPASVLGVCAFSIERFTFRPLICGLLALKPISVNVYRWQKEVKTSFHMVGLAASIKSWHFRHLGDRCTVQLCYQQPVKICLRTDIRLSTELFLWGQLKSMTG